jgi:hypothetical protein
MRVLYAVAVFALLAGPVHAQSPHVNLIPDTPTKTQEEKEADEAKDKAYRESLRKIPDAKTSSDPWGTVRSTDAPKTSATKASSAPAKPRTKTGSAAN